MDFEKARFNMVEQQIRPWEVYDARVLELLSHVKREDFVSEDKRRLAFADIELPLPNGSFMLQPKLEARVIQELAIQDNDKVLEVGTGSGYVTALLAKCAKWVFSLDIDSKMQQIAEQRLKKAGINNVTLVQGNGLDGLKDNAPFDVIVVGGSLPVVPKVLMDQLAIGGRMMVVVGDKPIMKMKRIRREADKTLLETNLFETCITRLVGFETIEPERFIF